MKKAILTLLGLGLAATATAQQEAQSNWYILAGANYTFGDDYEPGALGPRGAEFGFGWTLGSGWVVGDRFNFEIAAFNKFLNADFSDDVDQYGLEANGLFFLNRNTRFAPFALAGIGGADNNQVKGQGFEMYAAVGLGFTSRLGDSAGAATLRGDIKYFEEFGSTSLNDATVTLAVHIPVGMP